MLLRNTLRIFCKNLCGCKGTIFFAYMQIKMQKKYATYGYAEQKRYKKDG